MPKPNSADHAQHDLSLIAAHAAGDLPETDRSVVEALLSSCSHCTEVRRDLIAIAAATRALPAPMTLSRDFRLDEVQASRLARGSWLRSALRPFGASRSVVRPMAAAFTSLGVAGLLVAALLPGTFLAGSPAAGDGTRLEAANASDGPAAAQGSPFPQNAPEVTYDSAYAQSTQVPVLAGRDTASPAATAIRGAAGVFRTQDPDVETGRDNGLIAAPTLSPLITGSLGLLALGLILFGLRFAGRRLR